MYLEPEAKTEGSSEFDGSSIDSSKYQDERSFVIFAPARQISEEKYDEEEDDEVSNFQGGRSVIQSPVRIRTTKHSNKRFNENSRGFNRTMHNYSHELGTNANSSHLSGANGAIQPSGYSISTTNSLCTTDSQTALVPTMENRTNLVSIPSEDKSRDLSSRAPVVAGGQMAPSTEGVEVEMFGPLDFVDNSKTPAGLKVDYPERGEGSSGHTDRTRKLLARFPIQNKMNSLLAKVSLTISEVKPRAPTKPLKFRGAH